MNAGALRSRIRIYAPETRETPGGYVERDLAPVWECRARRTDATTREIWEASAAQARNIVNFEIRFHAGIKTGMIVRCAGADHTIIAVQRPEGLPRRMILKTTLKEAK